MGSKIICVNCDEESDGSMYKYQNKVYCLDCLEDYFNDELKDYYFDKFLDYECSKVEGLLKDGK